MKDMDDIIKQAVSILSHDGLIVYPTETVYGLGGDAFSDIAIERVYDAKNRLRGKPISIAISDIEMLACVAYLDPAAEAFINRFLPGPVTVILKAKSCVPTELTGGTGMIGIRIPSHPLALRLITQFDAPITATSANLHGAKEPRTPEECTIPRELLIDGGMLPGIPSTVVDLPAKQILRAGAGVDPVAKFLLTL